jgi:hypothetical protein
MNKFNVSSQMQYRKSHQHSFKPEFWRQPGLEGQNENSSHFALCRFWYRTHIISETKNMEPPEEKPEETPSPEGSPSPPDGADLRSSHSEEENQAAGSMLNFQPPTGQQQRRLVPREQSLQLSGMRSLPGELLEGHLSDRNMVICKAKPKMEHLLLVKAKKVGLCARGKEVQYLEDIAQSWQEDCSLVNAEKLWHVLYGQFDDNPEWLQQLEEQVMDELLWEYDGEAETYVTPKGAVF